MSGSPALFEDAIQAEQGFEKLEAENVKRAPVVGGHGREQRLLAQGCERGHCDV
ncbi:MAG: hypothetical protein IPI85_14885 [Dehalococcoidia bacterium]|nr:hypothetical protein [Dehalococcoidia bacterium]